MDNSGYDNIDDYLNGRLKGEALTFFENKMNNDPAFYKQVMEQKQAMDLLMKLGDMDLKKEAREAEQLFKKGKKTKSGFLINKRWIAVAASLFFVVLAYFALQNYSNEELFNKYYSAYNISLGVRNGDDPTMMQLTEATKFYNQQDYKKAVQIFESLQPVDLTSVLLMTGICQLEIEAYDKAIASFAKIIEDKDPVFLYHGYWYTALAYLKSGDVENCKIQLEKIIEGTGPNDVFKQAEAKALLKKI